MNRNQILWLCIAISCFLHLWALDREWNAGTPAMEGREVILPADFAMVAAAPMGNSLALEKMEATEDQGSAESAARQRLRIARKQYFQRVQAAVEYRKFQYNADLSGLLGNALYSFLILPDDTFTDIRLCRSSGDPLLDTAALNAIRAASGKVRRPKIIGNRTFRLSMAIKYQMNM